LTRLANGADELQRAVAELPQVRLRLRRHVRALGVELSIRPDLGKEVRLLRHELQDPEIVAEIELHFRFDAVHEAAEIIAAVNVAIALTLDADVEHLALLLLEREQRETADRAGAFLTFRHADGLS